MTRSWGPPPNYPPPRPSQSRPQYPLALPEDDYYPVGDPPAKRALFFIAGCCSTLIVVSFCICALAFLWVVDAQLGLTTDDQATNNPNGSSAIVVTPVENTPPAQPTPLPPSNQQPGQVEPVPTPTEAAPNLPFKIGDVVLAQDIGLELIVLDIQRQVQPNNFKAGDGLEFVAVSVELSNLQPDQPKPFQVADFQLQDAEGTVFQPDPQADNGRRLQDGAVPADDFIEGDIIFYIPLGHAPLILVWQATGSQESYLVELQ